MLEKFEGFVLKNAIVIPPVPTKTYDKVWLQRLIIESPSPSKPTSLYAEFVPYDGKETMSSPVSFLTIDDVFAAADKDGDLGGVLNDLFVVLERRRSGIIKEGN